MSPSRVSASARCRVLEEDVELEECLPVEDRERARAECTARVGLIARGPWNGEMAAELGEGIGLLVLHGLLIRRVGTAGRFGAELLGDGDLLRPWQGEDEPSALALTTGWRVLEPTRVALLDERFAGRLARHPQLCGRLAGRALRRSRNLAVNMAIVHQTRVDVRLHMLFWHLAGRWGRVRADGVSVPLRLTHAVLASLVAAHRPTVSSALGELARRGVVRPLERGWLLTGEPPGELLELASLLSEATVRPGGAPAAASG